MFNRMYGLVAPSARLLQEEPLDASKVATVALPVSPISFALLTHNWSHHECTGASHVRHLPSQVP